MCEYTEEGLESWSWIKTCPAGKLKVQQLTLSPYSTANVLRVCTQFSSLMYLRDPNIVRSQHAADLLLITFSHVCQVVRCLLIEPFPESALNEQAGKMLLENYEQYARHARSAFNFMSSAWTSTQHFFYFTLKITLLGLYATTVYNYMYQIISY